MTRLATLREKVLTPSARLVEFLHFHIQSTGQKSHCVNTGHQPTQCFVLPEQSDSLVRSSSKSAVGCLPRDPGGGQVVVIHGEERSTVQLQPSSSQEEGSASASPLRALPLRPQPDRPSSEPILFPRLRICLADFPYPHCSINQRLFTLET